MAVPRDIHKFLLAEGFRHVGMGEYWRFINNVKPVAWVVWVKHFDAKDEKFLDVYLHIGVPGGRYLNPAPMLCVDGLLRPISGDLKDVDLLAHKASNVEQTLGILKARVWQWLKVIADADVVLALTDWTVGVSNALPPAFDYLAEEIENIETVDNETFDVGAIADSFANVRERFLCLMVADRYEEAESMLLNEKVVKEWGRYIGYKTLLDCMKRRSLVTDEFVAWVDKKKLAPNRKW